MLTVTRYAGAAVTQTEGGEAIELPSLAALRDILSAPRPGPKGSAGYIVPCALRGPRCAANAQPTRLLALDCDVEGRPVLWEDLRGLRYLAHTTDSHEQVTPQNPSGGPRWRVFVELDRETAGPVACPWSWAVLRGPTQPAFIPARGDVEWRTGEGACVTWGPLQPTALVPSPVLAVRQMPTQETIDRFRHRWADDPRDTNKLAGTLGACLASGGWEDATIAAAFAAWFQHPDLARHTRSALGAAARRRAGERIYGFPEYEQLCGAPWAWTTPTDDLRWDLPEAAEAPATFGGVPILTARAIATAELPEPNWLSKQLVMAPGAPSLITGYGGSGKTTFVQHLAICVAQGDLFLGAYPVRRGPVVHIDHEQGPELTQKRYQRLGLREEADLRLICLPAWSMANVKQQAEFARLCATAKDGLVIIDSFLASCAAYLEDGENSSAARAPLDFLTKVSTATGATILVIHHSRKDRSDHMTSARGNSAITDAVSLHITYEKQAHGPGERPTLRIGKTRHEPPAGALLVEVEISIAPRGLPADAGYTLEVADPALARMAVLRDRIVELLATGWTGSRNALVATLHVGRNDAFRAVAELIQEGLVEAPEPVRGKDGRLQGGGLRLAQGPVDAYT